MPWSYFMSVVGCDGPAKHVVAAGAGAGAADVVVASGVPSGCCWAGDVM